MAPPLSRRGKETIPQLIPVLGHTEPPIYLPAHGRHAPESKRGGVQINLSTAENWLLRPELVPKFRSYIADNLTAQDLSYSTNLGGDPYLLQGLANYFNTNFDPAVPVRPEHIVTAPGASHLLESTFFHICDQGDGVMICTPYWPGFDNALQLHNNIVPIRVDIPFEDQNIDFFGEDTVRFYEEVLQDPVVPIKAMILCNPQNPIGRAYTREALEHILMMAERHDISVVVDELYGMSAFGFEHGDGGEKFTSVLSIDCHEIGVNPGRIHVIYSWSKDLASSGIRMVCALRPLTKCAEVWS